MKGLPLTVLALAVPAFNLSAATHYVSLDSPNPTPPFTNWLTAARVIQDAVDQAKDGDTVLVTNGVYAVGEREISVLDTNQQPPKLVSVGLSRVVVTNAITLRSVNGPDGTLVQGYRSSRGTFDRFADIRCAYVGTGAVLDGFTLTHGSALGGGGVQCAAAGNVRNCVISDNGAVGGGGAFGGTLRNCTLSDNFGILQCVICESGLSFGGGAAFAALYDCTISGNSTDGRGGGVHGSTLHACTLTGNRTHYGGGASESTLYNCKLSGNISSSWLGGGGASGSTLYYCTLTGNSAQGDGGGASGSTLYNCTLTGNSAEGGGGGVDGSTLYNCTLTENSAEWGGGASISTLHNCIVYFNSATHSPNYTDSTLNHCCTVPLPTNGVGNITGPPLFMDMARGDFRLWEGSPCIDAGTNVLGFPMREWRFVDALGDFDWVVVGQIIDATDILGNTRFIDGNSDGKVAWDIGAYEFNSFKGSDR